MGVAAMFIDCGGGCGTAVGVPPVWSGVGVAWPLVVLV